MTKEQVIELYKKYQEADYEYHKYVDRFVSVVIGAGKYEVPRGRLPEDEKKIQELDKNAYKAKIEFEEALKQSDWEL